MKVCPSCKNQYPDDANFCPREECAGTSGPQKLQPLPTEESVPRFVPLSHIGGGASGEVWQASDNQTGQAVAYKMVASAAFPTTILVDRCLRELKQLQRANNPRLARIVDFGKTSAGTIFVASELVSGDPLDERVRNVGPLALDVAKRIIAQIGEALLEGQKVGVIHRDLCPKNVLVDAEGAVKVINFAVPRPLSETVTGVPEYMSPEQAEGKLIDQRSNTYSLGAILYLLLTGDPPVVGATPQAVLEAIPRADVVPPSIKRGGLLTAEVDRVVLKALEKNSSRRPLTMRQFLSDVAALVATAAEPHATAESTPASGDPNAGFARTMMFAGGAAEVKKLVSQAMAARQAAVDDATAPMTSPVSETAKSGASGATPAQRPHAPTPAPLTPAPRAPVMASDRSGIGAGTSTPAPPNGAEAPSLPAVAVPPAAAGREPDAAGGGTNFRETLWFKKGDVDQMVAEARAKLAGPASVAAPAASPEPGKAAATGDSGPTIVPVESKPLEDRYLDDGTVTVDDRKKFSLRSGGTSAALPARGGAVPGERMSDDEVLGEIGGGKRVMIVGIVVAAVLAVAAVAWLAVGKKSDESSGDKNAKTGNSVSGSVGAPSVGPTKAAESPAELKAPPTMPAAAVAPASAPPAAGEKPEAATEGEVPGGEASSKAVAHKKPVAPAKKKSPPPKHVPPAPAKHR